MTFTSISYGGGVQSTAMLVLAATGRIHADVALFANTGDDSEHPATLEYVRNIAIPYGYKHHIPVIELKRYVNGKVRTLLGHIMDHDDPNTLREPIPIYGSNGAPLSRSCTADWKIKVLGRWLKDRGFGTDRGIADVLIGISVDEIERAGRGKNEKYENRRYPLLDLGLTRSHCEQVIRDAGLPVPPKSACYFCPFHRPQTWREMRRDEPELFQKSQELEDLLNSRRAHIGKAPVYLTGKGKRLSDAITEAQEPLFHGDGTSIGESGCDEGVCFV